MIGKGSSITCAVSAPEKDDTFEMYLNGERSSKLPSDSHGHWEKAYFKRYDWKDKNGTVSTVVAGYVDKFTKEHNNTMINCTSTKYKGHVAMKIRLRPNNSTNNHTGKNCF